MSEKKQKFEQAWIDEEEQREKWQRVIVEKPERPYHFTCTLSHYHGAAELWYNMCVFESRGRRVGGIALYHSWKTRNCVLCFSRKTTNLYGEAEYVVSQSVSMHFAYPVLHFAKGYLVVPLLRCSLGYAFFMFDGISATKGTKNTKDLKKGKQR